MSNDQFAVYLADLRENRIARPSGARPPPSSRMPTRRETDQAPPRSTTPALGEDLPDDGLPRSSSVMSHQRAQSAMSNYSTSSRVGRALVQPPSQGNSARDNSPESPVAILKPSVVVPSATYIERGQRWMEKEEACALRDALEDMDLSRQQEDREAQLHAAAQDEASELVWQHQNTQAIRPDAPYKYKEHLRKNSYAHARTQSVGRYSGIGMTTGLGRDITPRSVSGNSSSGDERRVSSDTSRTFSRSGNRGSGEESRQPETAAEREQSRTNQKKPYYGLNKAPGPSIHRRSSVKRNISGEPVGTFTGEQIWEEPEGSESPRQSKLQEEMPAPLRLKPRNPLNRVQFAQDLPPRANSTPPEVSKRISRFEIHRNPPSQSKNPAYTANSVPPTPTPALRPETPTKDGREIRSDEIRQATSMRLKDRSPKLPTPAVVSDKPGRPIVSFDANWKPKEADVKPVEERRRPRFQHQLGGPHESQSLPALPTAKTFATTSIPTIELPEPPSVQMNGTSSVPTITCSAADIPAIITPDMRQNSVSGPPSITLSEAPAKSKSTRPLPDPKTMSSRPVARHHATAPLPRGHWSPAGPRATATCHQCETPIEGRVVALRGLAQRWHPDCFICYTCGTGLEALEISPEPADRRGARLARIEAHTRGEAVAEGEGQTMADDGDAKLRFYCHLDWHELFAPRCKHCTTPIIGEHAVALGAHWHYGHFFCAECGDPFEQGMTHIEKDGYAWCLGCQTKRTERRAPKCRQCRGPVVGNFVQALGGEWHEDCFRCAECDGGFEDGKIFPLEDKGATVAVCVRCMERQWKA
ncbi:MAG: hypothetical protein M1818_007517 [Claussenomyces sp. TS43310]|nr:MAG: hypothetical protein M1818_007517 [Claussenomyces sp. TS43310]